MSRENDGEYAEMTMSIGEYTGVGLVHRLGMFATSNRKLNVLLLAEGTTQFGTLVSRWNIGHRVDAEFFFGVWSIR